MTISIENNDLHYYASHTLELVADCPLHLSRGKGHAVRLQLTSNDCDAEIEVNGSTN